MSVTFKFPTNVELNMMTREYVVNRSLFIGQTILPFKETMAQRVQWDEVDNEKGMTSPHVLGNDPKISPRPGSKLREYRPLYFKESELIKEDEMLNARAFATLGGVVNIDDLVADRLRARIDKDYIRAEHLIWKTLAGGFSINENGVSVAETFPIQTYTPVVAWTDPINSKPLADIQAAVLLYRGKGATGRGAKLRLNQKDLNLVLENKNPNDLFGQFNENFRKTTYSLEDLNKILEGRGLPTIEVYDEGYIKADGTWEPFIDDGAPILVGKRSAGDLVGNFMLTPSLHKQNGGIPAGGFFSMIEVNGKVVSGGSVTLDSIGAAANPKIAVITGFYGGTCLYQPKTIIKFSVR